MFQKLLECIEPPESAIPSIDEEFLGDAITPIKYDHDEVFGVPTLEELGKYMYYNLCLRYKCIKLRDTIYIYYIQCKCKCYFIK